MISNYETQMALVAAHDAQVRADRASDAAPEGSIWGFEWHYRNKGDLLFVRRFTLYGGILARRFTLYEDI